MVRIILLLMLAGGAARSTDYAGFLLSGRYENQLSGLGYRTGLLLLDENRVRFDVEADPHPRIGLEAGIWLRTYHGATEFDLTGFLPARLADSVPDSLRALLKARMVNRATLDRAYATVGWSRVRLKVGKQPLAWGTGYLWNPTEVIAAKALMDPSYEREGMNALRLDFALGPSLQLLALPGRDLERSTWICRLVGNVSGYDWAVTGWRRALPATFTQPVETGEYFAGAQFKGDALGLGVWAEGGWHRVDGDGGDWYSFCAGMDRMFATQTYVMAEYFRYGSGRVGVGDYDLAAWLAFVTGSVPSLGRDYAFAAISQPVFDFHRLTFNTLANLDDWSVLFMPGVFLGLGDNVDLSLFGTVALGGDATEYGAAGATGAVARFTLYF